MPVQITGDKSLVLTKLKCAIKIDWTAPLLDGGQPILGYKLEIGTAPANKGGVPTVKDDKFVSYKNCGS